MSEAAATTRADAPPRRGYARLVIDEVLGVWGARLGVTWVAILFFFAALAPFLASTHPYYLRLADGAVSYPLFVHLTVVDIVLAVAFVAATVLLAIGRRMRFLWKFLTFVTVLVVTALPAAMVVDPPRVVDYSKMRTLERDDQIAVAVRAPIPFSPNDRNPDVTRQAPSVSHWLGTDMHGQDVASRLIHASRISLAIGFIATGIAMTIGVILGALMGYFAGLIDLIGMRIVEVKESIPTLFLLLICVSFFGRDLYIMMALIGLVSWGGYCRFIRAEFLKLRKQDFVQAARACGLPLRSILFRHMLPNGVAPALVSASFGVASAILAEATISFLGLGLVEEPSWGQMLNQSLGSSATFDWWIALFPGLAIFFTVFGYNLIGEALRDAIDPYTRKRV